MVRSINVGQSRASISTVAYLKFRDEKPEYKCQDKSGDETERYRFHRHFDQARIPLGDGKPETDQRRHQGSHQHGADDHRGRVVKKPQG